ncbi:MAG: TonB-dependent receptor [Fidelibacterota bacterium]|nr:MAG: TonB-dependent receptor [Candidatus Neomarinimicrobiota bacterium]
MIPVSEAQENPLGMLTGSVTDLVTSQPLAGANLLVENTRHGAATDGQGRFVIPKIAVGSYTIRVEMIGYRPQSRANVHVLPQSETVLNFALEIQAVQGEEVVITGRFFESAKDAVVSARSVNIEEIRSDPAGAYDIQRMMEALPAVVLGSDQHNEIIVRGGGIGENLFIMDHLEIPNPNHFGEPGASGGAINVINTDFIERIDFYAGAFPARYGDRLSSVMDITLREGNRQRFQSHVEISMAGFGAVIEGPVPGGKGSYLGSYRKSFLDLVIRDVGLTAVPHYSNWQGKVALDLSPRNKLLFNFLGGVDNINLEGSTIPQTRGIDNVLADGRQFSYGATLKTLLSAKGYSLLSLGKSLWSIKYELFNYLPDERVQVIYDLDDQTSDLVLKGDLNYRLGPSMEVALGFNQGWGVVDRNSLVGDDTLRVYRYGISGVMEPSYVTSLDTYYDLLSTPGLLIVPDTILAIRDGVRIDSVSTNRRFSAYAQLKWRLTPRWELILGLRRLHMTANRASSWSPRLGLSFALTERTRFNLAFGRHYQAPSYYALYSYDKETLENMSTDQVVVGLEHLFADDTRGTLEVYRKNYHDLVLEHAETTPDSSDIYGGFVNAGEGQAQGLELFLQKKFTRRWYGSFSYSRYVSLADDPREGFEGQTYSRNSDFRDLLTIIGGYKIKFMERARYLEMKRSSWWPWVSWLPFMPADELELSFRYRMVGGRPYTPKVYNHIVRRWYPSAGSELNNERLRPYMRFDVMILRRFYFRKMNLVTFVDIQNVLDRDNQWDVIYYLDGTKEIALQYRQFPVGGVQLEF